jgi:hypothetical protein
VSDAIDVAHLQRAQNKGYDTLFKMAVWNVSQNVDRFKAPLGIVSAITPNGMDFASSQQRPLNGTQLLLLQGMLLDRIYFANESQKDRQNLACNAMSTTVIGASLIAALITGHKSLSSTTSSVVSSPSPNNARALFYSMLLRPGLTTQITLKPDVYTQFNLEAFKPEAMFSARMCICEGDHYYKQGRYPNMRSLWSCGLHIMRW